MPGWTARTDNGVAMSPPFIENHHSSKKIPPDHSHRCTRDHRWGPVGSIARLSPVARARLALRGYDREHGELPGYGVGLLPGQSRRQEDTGGRYVSAAISFGPGFGCIELNGGNCEPTLRPHH